MKTYFTSAAFPHFMLACTMGLSPFVSSGQLLTWEGDQDGNWNTTDNLGNTNWSEESLPSVGDILSFGGLVNTSTINDLAAGTSLGGISFTNDGTVDAQDAAFTLAGNSITLTGDIPTTASIAEPIADRIDLDLILGGGMSILAKTGHTLDINGDISGDFILSIGDNNKVNDEALVTFSGNNSHSLTSLTRNANLRIESETALGLGVELRRGASLFLANGLDLNLPSGITIYNGGAPSQAISLNEDGVSTASINAATLVTNLNYSQSLNFVTGEDDTLTINGQITGVSANEANEAEIRKSGEGTLVLTNPANDYIAQMRVLGGTLAISGAGILGDPTSSLRMNGGNLDLSGTTQTVGTVIISTEAPSGDVIHNGTLSATNFIANNGAGNATISATLTGTGGFTMSGAGIVTLTGTNSYAGNTSSTAGSLVATTTAALPGYDSPGRVIFDGGTIGVQVGGAGWTTGEVDTLLNNATKTAGALGFDTTNGDFTLPTDFSGTIGLTKLGANTLTLSGDNSYAGNTSLLEGALHINSATALGGSGTFFIGNGTTINNLSGFSITLTNNHPVILPGDGFVFGGGDDLNFGTGAVTLNLPPNEMTRIITLNGTDRTLTFGGDTTSPSRGGNTNIQVDGPGNTLVFGSLALNNAVANRDNAWSGSANVTVDGGILDGGDGGQLFTYSGTGTFTIGGGCTYVGQTTVNSGTLALAAGADLSDRTDVRINGGIIDLATEVSDSVSTLTIAGVNGDAPLADGTYGSSTSGATNAGLESPDTFFSGDGVLNVVFVPDVAEGVYGDWAGGEPFDADTNGDGVKNGLAWILGAASPDANALPLLPVPVQSGGQLSMTFTQLSSIAPAKLFVEYSYDLGVLDPWIRVEVPATSGEVDDVTFVVTPSDSSSS
ncbi:MAG: autotransporter-associated beta strand repeat-containing protein, partial [Akkermansiaceae bacterium]